MATETLSTFDVALKEFLAPAILKQFSDNLLLWQLFSKNNKGWSYSGKYFRQPLSYTRQQGVGAIAEMESLPEALYGKKTEAKVYAKYVYGRFQLSGQVIEASKKDVGAFISAMQESTTEVIESVQRDVNRQFWGDGSGVLCRINDADPDGDKNLVIDTPGSQYIEKGMKIGAYNPADNSLRSGSTSYVKWITSNTIIQLSDTYFGALDTTPLGANAANDDYICRLGACQNEIMGLKGIVDDGTFVGTLHGVNRSTYSFWKAVVDSASGTKRDLSIALMLKIIKRINRNGGKVDFICANDALELEYVKCLESDVRYAPQELRGGYKVLTFAGGDKEIPFLVDRDGTMGINGTGASDANAGMIYFLTKDTFQLKVLKDWGWIYQRSGNILQEVSGYDAVEALYGAYVNLFCEYPNRNGVLRDINVPSSSIIEDVYDAGE